MPDLGGDGDEAEKAPTLSPAAVACARGWMRRRRRTAAMASDGLGGAVPRSNPVTTVVLRPDPVAAGVPRLTSHGSTGGADDHGGGCNPSEAGGCCPGGGPCLDDSIDHTWAEEAVDSMMGLLAASSLGGAFSCGAFACHGKASKMG
uniref:Uncharacterized protein n=1 Tax=Oryza nivara TaxID=4536 RepID=A0A0E0I912_ORYNI